MTDVSKVTTTNDDTAAHELSTAELDAVTAGSWREINMKGFAGAFVGGAVAGAIVGAVAGGVGAGPGAAGGAAAGGIAYLVGKIID